METRDDVRIFVKESLNVISCPQNGEEVISSLEQVLLILKGTPCRQFNSEQEGVAKAKAEFTKNHFSRLLDRILQNLTVEWMSQVPTARFHTLLDAIVLAAPPSDTFLVLVNNVYSSSPGYKQNRCVGLLETFLKHHRLGAVFLEQSDVTMPGVKDCSHPLWNELVITISSLSDRMANTLRQEIGDTLLPKSFIPLVADDMLTALGEVHRKLGRKQDCSLQFLSQVFGKLCLSGYSDLLWEGLLHHFSTLTKEDFTWCTICERLVTKVPDRCLEKCVIPVFRLASWHGTVSRILGDAVLHNRHTEFIITKKLLLHRYYEQDVILQNIIGYLTGSIMRRPLLIKVLKMLLETWSDSSALKHTSYEQHAYISKAILVCLAFISDTEKEENKDALMSLMMSGVQCHLEDSNPKIRRLGMIIAESVTKAIDPGGHKLEFEYQVDEEVKSMVALLVPPSYTEDLEKECERLKISSPTDHTSSPKEKQKPAAQHPVTQEAAEDSDLDSDDDLVPYDMSNDTVQAKVKPPYYLRDCMEGLISSEDPDRLEICLQTAEKLIRQDLPSLPELAVEFTKILLHLDDQYNTVSFIIHRHAAMMALAVKCPTKVAPYITAQFYERNYNLRQRLDILEVLADSAKEISQPDKQQKEDSKPLVQVMETTEEAKDWRAVVQKRIESKTRRFAQGRKKGPPAVQNKFAPVAGLFFFPLMRNFDRQDASFDLLGGDCIVLSRLLYTLGIILYAALNAPIIPKMSSALLEFLWALRYHPDQSVRRGIIFALSMIILATPGFTLMTDLQAEIIEAKTWLEDVMNKDPENETKEMAIQALVLLENTLKQEFQSAGAPT